MDRPPGWLRLVSATTWACGVLAFLAGPGPYVWQPATDDTWLWTTSDLTTVDSHGQVQAADVVVLDPFSTTEQTIGRLHTHGQAAVCRLRAGAWEQGAPDAPRVPEALLGAAVGPDSRWLDIRAW